MRTANNNLIDWVITIIPIVCISSMAFFFFVYPEQSNLLIGQIRSVLGDMFGSYYLLIGLGVFQFLSIWRFQDMGILFSEIKVKSPGIPFGHGAL